MVDVQILDMPLEQEEQLRSFDVCLVKANLELARNIKVRLHPDDTGRQLLEKV